MALHRLQGAGVLALAVLSYETGQVWASHLRARDGEAATALMEPFFARLPQELVHRLLIYTDGLAAYAGAIEEQLLKAKQTGVV